MKETDANDPITEGRKENLAGAGEGAGTGMRGIL